MVQLALVAAVLSIAFFLAVRGVARNATEQTQDNILAASATSIADAVYVDSGEVRVEIPYSALSMLGYFCIGPYVNITMFGNPPLLSFLFPVIGSILMLLIALRPAWFESLSVAFAGYAILILYLTA